MPVPMNIHRSRNLMRNRLRSTTRTMANMPIAPTNIRTPAISIVESPTADKCLTKRLIQPHSAPAASTYVIALALVMFPHTMLFEASRQAGNLHNSQGDTPCEFSVREGEHSVRVTGNCMLDFIVLWSNPQVACLEPYMALNMTPGSLSSWTFRYRFE